jgi:hypothetical protein
MQGLVARRREHRAGAHGVMIDGYLVAVTVFSLGIAIIMALITWRAMRLARPETPDQLPLPARHPHGIEAPIVTASAPTWPPVRRDAVGPKPAGLPARGGGPAWTDMVIERTICPAPLAPAVGRAARGTPARSPRPASPAGGNRRLAAGLGLGALVVASALGSLLLFSERPAGQAGFGPAAPRMAGPIELVSLDSERDGDSVTIRGRVRNPAEGTQVEHLQAVIFLFDRRGSYLGTTYAEVTPGVLAPGSAMSFEVPLAGDMPVSRYRVSFRASTMPVPHVDRRPVPVQAPDDRGDDAIGQPAAWSASGQPDRHTAITPGSVPDPVLAISSSSRAARPEPAVADR